VGLTFVVGKGGIRVERDPTLCGRLNEEVGHLGGVTEPRCKENGPRAIWLIEVWCLMNNTIRELISFLVFMFVVHRMQDLLGLRN
jgi:hypothetical protein